MNPTNYNGAIPFDGLYDAFLCQNRCRSRGLLAASGE